MCVSGTMRESSCRSAPLRASSATARVAHHPISLDSFRRHSLIQSATRRIAGGRCARIDQLTRAELSPTLTTTLPATPRPTRIQSLNQGILLLALLLTIYIVLGILYERLHPSIDDPNGSPSAANWPSSGACTLRHGSQSDCGGRLLMLIGIVKKIDLRLAVKRVGCTHSAKAPPGALWRFCVL